jgi:Recombinase zinc beta ribbon domain/Family of unknown function (DUF5678)
MTSLYSTGLLPRGSLQQGWSVISRWPWSYFGPRYLLQGLLVCSGCGYAGVGASMRCRRNPQTYYDYYRCRTCKSGSDEKAPSRCMPCLRAVSLEQAVWQDVCALLKHPQKIAEEYERRLQSKPGQGSSRAIEPVTRIIAKLKRSISRLVDLYSEGLLEKQEVEPRLRAAKERLSKLEAEEEQLAAEQAQQAELRLALTCLQDFAEQVKDGLGRADWTARREVIRALVRRIKIDERDVRIVYRVAPVPFVEHPREGGLQDCPRSHSAGNTKPVQLLLVRRDAPAHLTMTNGCVSESIVGKSVLIQSPLPSCHQEESMSITKAFDAEQWMVDDFRWAQEAPDVQANPKHYGKLVAVYNKHVVAVGRDRQALVAKAAHAAGVPGKQLVVVLVPRPGLWEIPH